MKTSLDQQIQTTIQAFAGELSALVKQAALDSVRSALGDTSVAPMKRGPGRPKGSSAKGPSTSTSQKSPLDAERVLSYVRENPGSRSDQIATKFDSDTATVRGVLTALMAAKRVRREGQKRGTTYFVGGANAASPAAPAKKKARRKLSPAAVATLRANLAKARAARAAKRAG